METQTLSNKIKKILDSQTFAVLCTQKDGRLHSCLITYVITDDVKTLYFATPKDTKKFAHLQNSGEVSLLIDNREDHPRSINEISAITITGRTKILEAENDIAQWKTCLIEKYPDLKEFANDPAIAIVRIDVSDYKLVNKDGDSFIATYE